MGHHYYPTLTHLLKPKEYRVWCRPEVVPGDFAVTMYASKATCAVCLAEYRASNSSHKLNFKARNTGRDAETHPPRYPPKNAR